MATPIWQDTFYTTSRKYFRISGGVDPATQAADGLVFYSGAFPTASGGDIHLNTICAPRLKYGRPAFLTRGKDTTCAPQTFTVETSADGSTWYSGSRTFEPDWSYDTITGAARSFPINRHFHPQMTLLFSVVNFAYANTNGWYDTGGGHQNTSYTSMSGYNGCLVYPCSLITATGVKSVGLGTLTWDVPVECAPGALYYRNAVGGWDVFLIDASIKRIDSFKRWTRKITASNASTPNTIARNEYNYATEKTWRWELVTGGLTDTESATLAKHLLPSCDIWLHDFATGYIYPVVLETDALDVKTYKNGGRRVITYTLTVRLAQERIAQ